MPANVASAACSSHAVTISLTFLTNGRLFPLMSILRRLSVCLTDPTENAASRMPGKSRSHRERFQRQRSGSSLERVVSGRVRRRQEENASIVVYEQAFRDRITAF